MKNLFKISTGISEMPIAQQKNISGGFWDDTIGLSTVIIDPDPDWPSFSFPSSTPPTYGSGGGGGNEPDPEDNDNIKDPEKALEQIETKINEKILDMKLYLKLGAKELDAKDIQKAIDGYEKTLKTIELMKNSDNKYRIDVKDNHDNDPKHSNGEFYYDKKTGEYVILIEGTGEAHLPILVHELEHVDQFENGELGFNEDGSFSAYDAQDEMDAYQQQENFYFNPIDGYKEVNSDNFWDDYNKGGVYDYLKPKENGGNDGDTDIPSSYSRS
ncbi:MULTISPECIES: hypothetical protein [Empedobacter]|uniref:Uncharacterized protein n=1 Tax=Empedobacter falsenii TaxID=343874 RepID=A0A3R8UD17_9FLAO|nr:MULTISPECIES: hypothetical protein [Empedobacter]MDH1601818.1 hypothetical protein [Empedobacter sp. GD03739]RRT91823.1 hypothetical protein EGI89_07410 [Empedobacter falsenii]RRT92063.1 hypothetical protein EGI88_06950 [Empedobacter falsenii]